MALTKQIAIAAGMVAVFAVPAPAPAQTAFGQEMPQQYFLNRFTNPQPDPAAAETRSAGGAAQPAGAGAPAANGAVPAPAPAQTAFGQEMPQQYFLNRFSSPQPAPAAK